MGTATLTNARRIPHLESLLTRALERSNSVHAQLIAAVLASALVDISAPRGIVLVEAEAFFASAHNRAILRGANLLAAAVVVGARVYRVARFVPQLVTERAIASISAKLVHAFVRAAAVIVVALVHIGASPFVVLKLEAGRALATITATLVDTIVGASSVLHLALVNVEAGLGVGVQVEAVRTLAGETTFQIDTYVRATAIIR